MTSQLELPSLADPPRAEDAAWLIERLERLESGACLTAREILLEAGLPVTEGNKRLIRLMAEHSEGEVLGMNNGYCLVTKVDKATFDQWANRQLSQCDEMKRRVIASQKLFYNRPKA